MRGTETKMDLEFGIYKKSTRRSVHKWVVAIPHDVLRDFLGVRRLHRQHDVYFHHWTVPRPGFGSDVLVCFSLSRTREKLSWSPRGAAALKLTTIGNGPFGICNPSLRRVDGTTGFIPVPDRYESSRRLVSATAETNGGNAVYSFPVPAGWSSPPLVGSKVKLTVPSQLGGLRATRRIEPAVGDVGHITSDGLFIERAELTKESVSSHRPRGKPDIIVRGYEAPSAQTLVDSLKREVEPKLPYTVEADDSKTCAHCGAGRTWDVVGPTGVALGRSFGDEEAASDLADDLSCAYLAGVRAAIKVWQG